MFNRTPKPPDPDSKLLRRQPSQAEIQSVTTQPDQPGPQATAQTVLKLQSQVGNQAVQRMIRSGAIKYSHQRPGRASRRAVSSASVQRTYSTLAAMGKARIDSQSERMYSQKAEEFEFKIGPMISKEPAVLEVVEKMLGMLKKIVDAWAKATGQTTFWGNVSDEFYEREFAFAASDKYYGAFEKTATSIKKVFNDKSQPIRKKLHLIYNAVRNNNLAKYLKAAALEMEDKAKGGAKKSQKIFESDKNLEGGKNWGTAKPTERNVKSGFAKSSGLSDILSQEGNKRQKSFAEIGEREKWGTKGGEKIMVSAPDTFSDVHGWSQGVSTASRDRAGGQNTGLTLDEQRTLNVGDVEDLTSSEIRQLSKAKSAPVPKMSKSEKQRFKRDNKDNKIAWEQGREYYSVILNSETDKQAAQLHARLEAGVSGSTDLMLHAAQNLALSEADLYKLRLTMVGWMLSNHDHSFWEIMTAATNYGLPFETDPTRIGSEYESANNFRGMDVKKLKTALPEGQFPGFFVSDGYKDTLSGKLTEPDKTKGAFQLGLNTDNIPKTVTDQLDERATAELHELDEVVKRYAVAMQGKDLTKDDESPQKRALLRQIKQDPAYMYLGRRFPVHADFMLNALIEKHIHHNALTGANRTLPGISPEGLGDNRAAVALKLTSDVGIPAMYMTGLQDYQVYDLKKFAEVVKVEAPKIGPADPTDQEKIITALKENPLFKPLARANGENWSNRVLSLIIQRYSLDDLTRGANATRITKIEEIADMVKTTGVWYSWGNLGMLEKWAAASSIKDFSFLANTSSDQGPGLYVATDAFRSEGYGGDPGSGMIVATFNNVPTMQRGNKPQTDELKKLTYNGGPLTFNDLYQWDNHAEMLLRYGAGFARLTTNKGVTLTTNLSTVDAALLKTQYDKVKGVGARQNMKAQAHRTGVDVSGWPD